MVVGKNLMKRKNGGHESRNENITKDARQIERDCVRLGIDFHNILTYK
jgi:hypothetical protein